MSLEVVPSQFRLVISPQSFWPRTFKLDRASSLKPAPSYCPLQISCLPVRVRDGMGTILQGLHMPMSHYQCHPILVPPLTLTQPLSCNPRRPHPSQQSFSFPRRPQPLTNSQGSPEHIYTVTLISSPYNRGGPSDTPGRPWTLHGREMDPLSWTPRQAAAQLAHGWR